MNIHIETTLNSETAIFTTDFAKFVKALYQGIHTVVFLRGVCNCFPETPRYLEGMSYSEIITEFVGPWGSLYKKHENGGSKNVGFVNCGHQDMFRHSDKEFFDVGKMVRPFSPAWDSDILLSLSVLLENESQT